MSKLPTNPAMDKHRREKIKAAIQREGYTTRDLDRSTQLVEEHTPPGYLSSDQKKLLARELI